MAQHRVRLARFVVASMAVLAGVTFGGAPADALSWRGQIVAPDGTATGCEARAWRPAAGAPGTWIAGYSMVCNPAAPLVSGSVIFDVQALGANGRVIPVRHVEQAIFSLPGDYLSAKDSVLLGFFLQGPGGCPEIATQARVKVTISVTNAAGVVSTGKAVSAWTSVGCPPALVG